MCASVRARSPQHENAFRLPSLWMACLDLPTRIGIGLINAMAFYLDVHCLRRLNGNFVSSLSGFHIPTAFLFIRCTNESARIFTPRTRKKNTNL